MKARQSTCLDLNNQLLHRINTDDFNLQNVRAIFYSDRINRWILLGHPQSLGQREELRIRTFEFDSRSPMDQHGYSLLLAFEPDFCLALSFLEGWPGCALWNENFIQPERPGG
jgi:hypothetical protein